ncbi:MAG: right-handed parallel beta-helix repeat-containing protein [Planctomycetota bacterium]
MRNVVLICVFLMLTCPCIAKTITVDDDGPADFNNIQAAINDANDGDTVLVKDGTYTGTGNRDIDFLGKAITVRSENGSGNCIIDCNGTENDPYDGFVFCNNEDANSVLDGFTIIRAISCCDHSGAISCQDSSPTIKNCNITGNTSWGVFCYGSNSSPTIKNCSISHSRSGSCGVAGCYGGGGIYCRGGSPKIANCNIADNTGPGILCRDSSPIIKNCNIANNAGCGIYCIRGGSPTITNCNIIGNKGTEDERSHGGGIYCSDSNPTITSCTISGNSAEDAGGGIYATRNSNLTVNNCILWSNTAILGNEIYLDAYYSSNSGIEYISEATVSYSDVEGGVDSVYVEPNSILNWGQGNIDADPCFVMLGYWVDVNGTPADPNDDVWVDGDYHLLWSSPCIDTGDPNYAPEPNETDLDGIPRVINNRIDMGAYEYMPPVEVEMKLTPQMLNCESKGKWIKTHVILPEGFYAEDVDVNAPAAAEPVGIESEFIEVNEYSDGSFDVQIYFEREGFCEVLSDTEEAYLEVTVTGSLTNGRKFEGSDTIRLKTQHRRRRNYKGMH